MITKQYLYTSLLVFVFQVENYFQRKTNDFPQSNEKHFKLLFGKHPKHDMKRSFPQLMTVDVVTNVNVGVRES